MNWSLLYLISEWAIRLIMLVYVPQRRSAAASRTWLLLIFLLPWPGLVLYAIFGRIYVSKRRIALQLRASQHIREVQAQMAERAFAQSKLPPDSAAIALLASRLGDFDPFGGNNIELLTNYDAAIDRIVADIQSARNHVHLLHYIFCDDETGMKVANALMQAAKRGVQCRVLMDAVGSREALKRLAPRMREHGIEVNAMLPVTFFHRNPARFDLRNHRKIIVIDGQVGFTGSQNMVNPRFVKGYPNEELTVRATGVVVAQLQAIFLADHYFEAGGRLEHPELFPDPVVAGESICQLVPSGPGYQRENGQELMITLLYAARKSIVITTPYFVPDEPFLQAVSNAAFRGVEVDLVVSAHANQTVTQWAQRSFYDELLSAGIRIHLYQPRFLHAKHISIDDHIVVVGSTNIDIRSFALNAEVNMVIYDPAVAGNLRAIQQHYFANSRRLDPAEWNNRSLATRTLQSMARLADSLL
jgi:cardiolipin synthase A/B